MPIYEIAMWGLFGSAAVELLQFSAAIRRNGTWPWKLPGEPTFLMFLTSFVIRVGAGVGLACSMGAGGQITGPFGAIVASVAAPKILEQLAESAHLNAVPVSEIGVSSNTDSPPEPPSTDVTERSSGGQHAS